MNFCNNQFHGFSFFASVLNRAPHAFAILKGSDEYPSIDGKVHFYQTKYGTLVATEVSGLPEIHSHCQTAIFAYHIHEGNTCTGNCIDPFGQAMSHYNPKICDHPYHAGDLPPLFSNNGYAFSVFLTNKFDACEVVKRTILIHLAPDDFTSQPSGNSGARIACGVIELP